MNLWLAIGTSHRFYRPDDAKYNIKNSFDNVALGMIGLATRRSMKQS